MKIDKKTVQSSTGQSVSGQPTWPRALGISLWILLVIVGFWSPYLHLPISMSALTGLYGVFVLVGAAIAALGLLRRSAGGEK